MGAFGVLISLALFAALQDNSALFVCWVFIALLAAGATTYLRDIESEDDSRWDYHAATICILDCDQRRRSITISSRLIGFPIFSEILLTAL